MPVRRGAGNGLSTTDKEEPAASSHAHEPRSEAGSVSPQAVVPSRVLIVEDEPTNALLLRRVLEREGLTVIGVATDGAAALEQIASQEPDLVILDLNVPVVDGYEVLERLAALDDRVRPAVLVLSGDDRADTRQRVLDLGAADFVLKPFDRADIVTRTMSHLRARRSEAAES
jgi:DNA-binding response OmpR family regulator